MLPATAASAQNATKYSVKEPPLTTDWKYKTYQNASSLNDTTSLPFGQTLANEVLIPSCLESGLPGIQGENTIFSWFSTSFTVPSSWSGRKVLLNFAAVDYEATVYTNGNQIGFNRGGYFRFTIDATEHVTFNGTNELLVFVHDPVDSEGYVIPIGKQTLRPSHIFYTPCSGIWQSVWTEAAPENHITQLDVDANMDGKVNMTVHSSAGSQTPVEVTLDGRSFTRKSDTPLQFAVDSPDLWSPNSPTLYNFTVKLGDDEVKSYTGFRTISKAEVNGIVSPILNGKPIFMFGTLDQGFWPDGIYTAPNREAVVYDLNGLKKPNFSIVRKHIKDMPSLRADGVLPDEAQQTEFTRQLEILVNQHKSYQIIYNEGWGQLRDGVYPEFGLTDLVHSIDPTRLMDSTSGWFDHGAGDFSDNHHYANPQCGTPFCSINSSPFDPTRIGFQGEFGAIDTINQTYEIDQTLEAWRYRGHFLLDELKEKTSMYSCNGGVWTQTTDVEGEVKGLLTYDRRVLRPNEEQWRDVVQVFYDAAVGRGNTSYPTY
ncbi:hydrolase [Leptodontidium sp. MPI-SDFR-AT-0119]|nr:hydrolase [Leptodontidium sp. MPI-SDFR-AT-0119]